MKAIERKMNSNNPDTDLLHAEQICRHRHTQTHTHTQTHAQRTKTHTHMDTETQKHTHRYRETRTDRHKCKQISAASRAGINM